MDTRGDIVQEVMEKEPPYLEEDNEFTLPIDKSSVTIEDVLGPRGITGKVGPTGDVSEEISSNSEAAAAASLSAPNPEEQKEIRDEVQKAIDSIVKNPSQIKNIVNGLKGDKNVLRQVLDFLQKNPQLKKQAMDRAMGSAPTMQELSRMSKKERDEIMKKAKEARKELAALNPTNNKAVIINISRVAKEYPVSSEFPSGSKFCDGTVEELKHGLHYVYLPDEKRVNKRASQITGQTTCGEIVIFRLNDTQDEILDFTLEEFNTLFPKNNVSSSSFASTQKTPVKSTNAKSSSRRR